jgi:hypothetical protein
VIDELRNIDKPFAILLNSTQPHAARTQELRAELEAKYNVPVIATCCLELTESTSFTFSESRLNIFEKLKAEGVSIALDDFGTGNSSLNKLIELPVDYIKIERIFVDKIESDSYQRFLFRQIAELAHAANMIIVAEGVENPRQMDVLLKNGADLLQGFLFGKPVSASELEHSLKYFYEKDPSFNTFGKSEISLSAIYDMDENYFLSPALYKLMNRCMRLIAANDSESAIQYIIETIGRHLDVNRVYVFRHIEGTTYSNTYEWCAEGMESHKDLFVKAHIPKELIAILTKQGIIQTADIEQLPYEVQDAIRQWQTKSLVIIPIKRHGKICGFMGMDDAEYRHWLPDEILMLLNLAAIIAALNVV